MSEVAHRFGRADHLLGITGHPAVSGAELGVIVLNAGLVHRIGPFRLHVELTRRLNASGYPTLRFDLSTRGDSCATGESQSREAQIRADAADAMALLAQQAGCTRFVLIGLCSGAENAHLVACTDAHVAGAIFLDPLAWRTWGFRWRHYLPRLINPVHVARFVTRLTQAAPAPPEPDLFAVPPSPRSTTRAQLADMLERGLKLCFIYSGGASAYFNHPRQFRECFGKLSHHPGVTVETFAQADHTYVLVEDREQLTGTIMAWFDRSFPCT